MFIASHNGCVRVFTLCDEARRGLIAAEVPLHLEEMTGRPHGVPDRLPQIENATAPCVLLGLDKSLGCESYACRIEDGRVRISGGDERGLYYGTQAFFEALGFRWFAPGADGTVVPRTPRPELPDNWRASGRPLLRWRGLHICGTGWTRSGERMAHFDHETALWMARNRMNFKPIHNEQYDAVLPHLEELLLSPLAFGHSYGNWVPSSEHAARPDFFPLVDGQRLKEGQRCLSNTALRDEWVARIARYIDAHPRLPIISLAPNDGYRWCQCEGCAAMDSAADRAKSEMNRRNHAFAAEMARRVAALRPGYRLSTISYSNYLDPAADVPREDALAVSMCITRAQNKALDDPASPSNRAFLDRLNAWRAKAGEIFWSAYYLSYGGTFPRPYEHQLVRTFRALAEHGAAGIKSEVTPGRFDRWQSAVFFMYLVARAAYDGRLDPDALLEDFCARYYGPAGPHCLAYYRTNSEAVRRYVGELTHMDATRLPALYSDADMARMAAAVADAGRAVAAAERVHARRLAPVQRQMEELALSRREVVAARAEAADVTARHLPGPPDFADFDGLQWTTQRVRTNFLPYPQPSRFAACWTDEALWLCFRLGEPDMERVVLPEQKDFESVWILSNVDCFLCPDPASGVYYQVAANVLGATYSARCRAREWNSGYDAAPVARVRLCKDRWELILGLPFERLGMNVPRAGDRIRAGINRGQSCQSPKVLGGWPNGGSWHSIQTMGELVFGKETP